MKKLQDEITKLEKLQDEITKLQDEITKLKKVCHIAVALMSVITY